MSGIVLTNGVRQNLLSLQNTSVLEQTAQLRLATGKKVNSAIDDPVNYFTAAGLSSRSDQLTSLLDGMSNSVQTIQAASAGIDSITKLVQSAQATIKQALNDAAQNRPSKTASTSLASASEISTANKSAQDVALDKLVEGSSASPATATSSGSIGIAAGSTVTLSAGKTTYSFTTSATMTVRDLVNNINNSGVAVASVDSSGKFTITGTGSDALKFNIQSDPTNSTTVGDGDDNLGYSSADSTALSSTGVTATANSAVRTGLIAQFNSLLSQIDKLASDAGYNGTNLLGGDTLKVTMNEKTGASRNQLQVQGFSVTSSNLGLQQAANGSVTGSINFQNDTDLNTADQAMTTALSTLQSMSSTLGTNLSVVQTREDFTKNLVTTLKTGSDHLVIADSNEESANLLALQTRQQLSTTALSLASQADQSVLKLFG